MSIPMARKFGAMRLSWLLKRFACLGQPNFFAGSSPRSRSMLLRSSSKTETLPVQLPDENAVVAAGLTVNGLPVPVAPSVAVPVKLVMIVPFTSSAVTVTLNGTFVICAAAIELKPK